ncbi:MAG: PAS domain-containing sensor histidine kinase [Pseudodesulfovibrio sp.]|uniref:histidine kinase n=1 Tax=Pseudodesulfovibrio indicus TaxID=1716143 RepID=A0A126QJ42_9BACT|nr:ATP-binding protein [Pseudodesulfovibrio indicus]AMK10004.1 PAS domain-containing sensor histidine kinase [Pseudodesulfovibrio indicus]TDT87030.1 two-component system nitrogen regulation sensor histidine kinase NtrY [Pseudodesulfovibrio indicus]
MSPDPIRISSTTRRDERRHRREYILALVFVVLIAGLTWAELKYLSGDYYLILNLLILNVVFLVAMLFYVARNAVRLILERRRRVLGSKLRTRLVLAFISLSLIPTALIYLVSVKFVQTSVDYWFKGQVEESMEQALELGRAFYGSAQDRLERRGSVMIKEIIESKFAWGGKGMDNYLNKKFDEYDLSLVGVINPEGNEQNTHATAQWSQAWPEIKEKIDWQSLRADPRSWTTIIPKPGSDLVLGVTPVDEGRTGYLVLGETVGQGLLHRLDQIVRGLDEYKKLKTRKYPWKMNLYLTLGVMALLIILGAIWFGFRLAKELSAPVQALAAGTERIGRGDLSVRLEDRSDDELGFLVQSFNRMAEDLEQSQDSVHQANERLAQQNQELERRGQYIEAVLNNITSGVISMDSEGRIGTVNTAAENILGIPGEFLIGKVPFQFLSGDFADMVQEALAQLSTKPGGVWQRQLDLPVRGKLIKVLVNVVSLKNVGGRVGGHVAVFEDITELEKIQRLAAWREVARRIAHEIKNPLTPIKLSAQRLQRKYGGRIGEDTFNECTDLIVKQVERLQNMVTEFSAYAKLPEVQPRPDQLGPLLEEVTAMFANTHRDIRWDLSFSTPIGEFPFDREGIRKVLINLLTNAAEALKGMRGGEVQISATHDTDSGTVTISVADNGPGLPKDSSRMFEPYYTKKRGGTGLGLTIVRSIISDHGGMVRAASNHPKGTVFIVELHDA